MNTTKRNAVGAKTSPAHRAKKTAATGRSSMGASDPGGTIVAMKVRAAAKALGSQDKLAKWVGVHRSQATRWADGESTPSIDTQRAVTDLEFIVSRAAMVWDDSVIPDWLNGRSAFLGGATPLEMIRRGRTAEVLEAISAEEAGVYA